MQVSLVREKYSINLTSEMESKGASPGSSQTQQDPVGVSPSPDGGGGGIILGSNQVDTTLASGSAASTPAAPRDDGAAGRLLALDGCATSHPSVGSGSTLQLQFPISGLTNKLQIRRDLLGNARL